jgi:hypothetical protein
MKTNEKQSVEAEVGKEKTLWENTTKTLNDTITNLETEKENIRNGLELTMAVRLNEKDEEKSDFKKQLGEQQKQIEIKDALIEELRMDKKEFQDDFKDQLMRKKNSVGKSIRKKIYPLKNNETPWL